jgi:cytochrome c oxidase subunit 1
MPLASIGALTFGFGSGLLLPLCDLARYAWARASTHLNVLGNHAEGLEWEVPSPAPFHTFETPPKLDATATKIVAEAVNM